LGNFRYSNCVVINFLNINKLLMKQQEKIFNVKVKRIIGGRAEVEAHGQKIVLATRGDDPNLGITAPETVLAAFGACVISNINKISVEAGLKIDDVSIEFQAKKRLNPLGFEDLHYIITIQSPEPKEKLQVLYDKASTNGTATNALLEGLKPVGELNVVT
jgi:uncharacterized OsmC-like protein